MCIICTNEYDTNLTILNCLSCNEIKEIPKEFVNLEILHCYNT